MNAMSLQEAELSDLMAEIKAARETMSTASAMRGKAIEETQARLDKQDKAINALSVKLGRPAAALSILTTSARRPWRCSKSST